MLIDNGGSIQRHKKTGRALNKWSPSSCVELELMSSSSHRSSTQKHLIIEKAHKLYMVNKPRTNVKKSGLLYQLLIFVFAYPDKVVYVRSTVDNYRMLSRLCTELESLGVIEIFQGYSYKSKQGKQQSIPMGVRISPEYRALFKLSVEQLLTD